MAGKQKHIILGITGSIAAYKAADLVRELTAKAFKVSVVMTKEAKHFITPLTLAALSGGEVYQGLFDKKKPEQAMTHIALAEDADVLLIAPATANIIGKMAHGLADDLLTCIALVTSAPIIVVPAMNTRMYHNPIVRQNCDILKKHGALFVEPVQGKLACGTTGEGHIADENAIVMAVEKCLK